MTITKTFVFTGASQAYTLPAKLLGCTIECYGPDSAASVPGGYILGQLRMDYDYFQSNPFKFVGGEVVQINVGGIGGAAAGTAGGAGGFNGGGKGGNATGSGGFPGGGGAGATDVRFGGTTLDDRILIAGGAGASGRGGAPGGAGGGLNTSNGGGDNNIGTGEYGTDGAPAGSGGAGGNQGQGGAGGTGGAGAGGAGSYGLGGNGANTGGATNRSAGGGGGGKYGGGAGGYSTTGSSGGSGGGANGYNYRYLPTPSWSNNNNTNDSRTGYYAPGYSSSVQRQGKAIFTMVVAFDTPSALSPISAAKIAADKVTTFSIRVTSADPTTDVESATLSYRLAGATTWTSAPTFFPNVTCGASGVSISTTVAANTFTPGKTYEWQMSIGGTDSGISYSDVTPIATFVSGLSAAAAAASISNVTLGKIPGPPAAAASASAALAGGFRYESFAATSQSQAIAGATYAPPAVAGAQSASGATASGNFPISGAAAASSASRGESGGGPSFIAAISRSQVGTRFVFHSGQVYFPALYFPGEITTGRYSTEDGVDYTFDPAQGVRWYTQIAPGDAAATSSSSASVVGGGSALPLTGIAAVTITTASAAAAQLKTPGSASALAASSATAGAVPPVGITAAATSYSTGAVDNAVVGKSVAAGATSGSSATAASTQRKPGVAAATSTSAVTVAESPFLRGLVAGAASQSSANGDPRTAGALVLNALPAASVSGASASNQRQVAAATAATSISAASGTSVASSTRTGAAIATSASGAQASATAPVAASTLNKTSTFIGGIDGTFDANLGVLVLTAATPNATEDVRLVMTGTGRLTVHVPSPPEVDVDRRARLAIAISYQSPTIMRGVPRLPRWGGRLAVGGNVLTGYNHIRAFPDPDPVWGGSAWTFEPPAYPEGSNFERWTVKDLPDPAGYPGKKYNLGTLSAVDGTAGQPSSTSYWRAAAGSSFALDWRSAYPFKPTVQEFRHVGKNGQVTVEPKAIYFNRAQVDHMWCDWGTYLSAPFTLMAVVLLSSFTPNRSYNWIFDSGTDPTPYMTDAQRLDWLQNGPAGPIAVPEAFGYRSALAVNQVDARAYNDYGTTTRIGKVPYSVTYKPQVIGFVYNGAKSAVFVYGEPRIRQYRTFASVGHGAQRFGVMGRKDGILSPDAASSMIMFELRTWDTALSPAQLAAHYAQLSTTWKFGNYK